MRLLGPPDWLIYFSVLVIVLVLADKAPRQNAPPAPPPPPGEEGLPLDPALPFNPAAVIRPKHETPGPVGAAFSIGETGLWLTEARMAGACARLALSVGPDRVLAASRSGAVHDGVAVIATHGGTPPLRPRTRPLQPGERAFAPGFPQGRPGEIALRYLGQRRLAERGQPGRTVLLWAETGRTEDINGPLEGLAGAPVIDGAGDVIGVVLSSSPRRGRLYSTAPDTLAKLGVGPAPDAPRGEGVTVDNYGRIADALRRQLRVARVSCLTG